MNKDLGASAEAETGSRASTEPGSTVSALTGFDPARWTPFAYAHRYPTPFGPSVWRVGGNGREINATKPTEVIQLYSTKQVAEIVASALASAIEARSSRRRERDG